MEDNLVLNIDDNLEQVAKNADKLSISLKNLTSVVSPNVSSFSLFKKNLSQLDYYSPKESKGNKQQIEKYYVEGVEFSRAQMKILFTEAVFEKLKHKQKRNYCGKNVEVRYEYI